MKDPNNQSLYIRIHKLLIERLEDRYFGSKAAEVLVDNPEFNDFEDFKKRILSNNLRKFPCDVLSQ